MEKKTVNPTYLLSTSEIRRDAGRTAGLSTAWAPAGLLTVSDLDEALPGDHVKAVHYLSCGVAVADRDAAGAVAHIRIWPEMGDEYDDGWIEPVNNAGRFQPAADRLVELDGWTPAPTGTALWEALREMSLAAAQRISAGLPVEQYAHPDLLVTAATAAADRLLEVNQELAYQWTRLDAAGLLPVA